MRSARRCACSSADSAVRWRDGGLASLAALPDFFRQGQGTTTVNALRLDNRTVPLASRGAYWRDAVHGLLQVESETRALGGETFETLLEQHEIGPLRVMAISGSAQQLQVRDWDNTQRVHLLLPRTAGGFVEAQGTRQALQPDRSYFVNVRGPLLIQAPVRFEHIGLFFPVSASEFTPSFIQRHEAGPVLLSGAAAQTLSSALPTLLTNAPGMAAAAAPIVARAMIDLFHAALIETPGGAADAQHRLQAYHRERIRRHARAALGDPDLNVDRIAAAVGLSPRRVHQLFADSGTTLMRWIWSERLAQCHARLADAAGRSMRISDLAYEWGFSDPAHFSRAFRQRYGITPQQHIALHSGEGVKAIH